jgi:hypothetical protein
MRKFGWVALLGAGLMVLPGMAHAGRVALLEQTMNVGCG